MAQKISGLNYDAVLSSQDYVAYRQTLEKELVERLQLTGGLIRANGSWSYGIVDAVDPKIITSPTLARPLGVKASATPLALYLDAGYAVTQNGTILYHPAPNPEIQLAVAPAAGEIYLLVIESQDVAGGTSQLNRYNVIQDSQIVVQSIISVYGYSTGWTPTDSQIVLAVVRVVEKVGNVLDIQIDLTQNTYTFNRPWFSTVDTQHRSFIGSGTVTNTNPHGMSVNDLTLPSTVGLFQGLTGQGSVVSRDLVINKMTGARLCTETIPFAAIKTDVSGAATQGSIYNRVGALYAELGIDPNTGSFPYRLGSVWDSLTPANPISADLIQGTNLLVFGPLENITSDQLIKAQYTSAQFLAPPVITNNNFLQFNRNALDGEACTIGGFVYGSIPDGGVSAEGLGPFSRRYRAHMAPDTSIAIYPQILVPAASVFAPLEVADLQFPARIAVGLTNTTGSPLLDVQVTLTGEALADPQEGIAAGVQTEVLTFSLANGYVDQVIPSSNYDLVGQLLFTKYRYSQITAISVVSNNGGPNPQIQVWAEIEAGSVTGMEDYAPLANIFWNGSGVARVSDIRNITPRWVEAGNNFEIASETELDSLRMLNFLESGSLLTQSSVLLFAENFENLRYFDTARGFFGPTKATGVLGLNSSSPLIAGDTIVINTSPLKILTAISGTPVNPGEFSVGSFLAPISLSQIRTNMIAAINDVAFAAQVTAVASTVNPLNINLTLDALSGVAANAVALSFTVANPGALSATGYNFAVDGYGECFMARHLSGLGSQLIPSNSNLNPYEYSYRNRYRSRALSTPPTIGAQTQFAVQVLGEDKGSAYSLRIRGSTLANSKVWEGWQIMTPAASGIRGLYTFNFLNPVHKIQIEYYGRARGIAAYMVRT
jgi:hypothetical protein